MVDPQVGGFLGDVTLDTATVWAETASPTLKGASRSRSPYGTCRIFDPALVISSSSSVRRGRKPIACDHNSEAEGAPDNLAASAPAIGFVFRPPRTAS